MNKQIFLAVLLLLIFPGMAFAQQRTSTKATAYAYENSISVASLEASGNVSDQKTVTEGNKAENITLDSVVTVVPMSAAELAEGKAELSSLLEKSKMELVKQEIDRLKQSAR